MVKKPSGGIQGIFFQGSVPQMPAGYYSGDKPNPNLKAFVEAHLQAHPYDAEADDYAVPAFDHPINATKATAIYNMHTYWSKKPHDAIREYIRHYTQPGDLVLDPFCGSGGTALAALMEGRKAIAIDRSPAATFITKNYCTPVDVNELREAFEELKRKVKPEIDWLYETKCDRCGGKATTAYTVYSQVFKCPRCLNQVPLFDCEEVAGQTAAGKPRKVNACPHCYEKGIVEAISTRDERFGAVPVLVSYICQAECKPQREQRKHNDLNTAKREYFEKYDLEKIRKIENTESPYWLPPHKMMNVEDDSKPWGAEWREGRNFRRISELFTKRNLFALAAILNAARGLESPVKDSFLFAFSAVMLNCSRMYRYRDNLKGGFQQGTYYVPQESQIINVWRAYEDKISNLKQPLSSLPTSAEVTISTQSATEIDAILSDSTDYIFTDPPYADKIQYGELNFVWEAWLGFDTHWHDEEIIINGVRGKTEVDWASKMRYAMSECFRVLKPGRWLSLCYHDTSEGTWSLIQDIMAEVGFVVDKSSDSALFIDTGSKSYNQIVADKVNKRDLVINFRKPKLGEAAADVALTGDEDSTTFNDKVRTIIRDYLIANPGTTKDRIYDQVVSRMVRSGQMEAHNFDELLEQTAEVVVEPLMKNLFEPQDPDLFGTHEIRRWYLQETEEVAMDAAESAKEDAAAQKISRFIEQWLQQHPAEDGVHYSDLFEQYIYSVPTKDKPRRQLQDWLLDYFYKNPAGTYRLAMTDEEAAAKVTARAAGTNRRVKRFLSYLQQGLAVPTRELPNDATLAEWIRHCKRSGLYEHGKLLYEHGGLNLDNLSEALMVEVEEDYQVCARMLSRTAGAKTAPAVREKERNKSSVNGISMGSGLR